MAMAMLEQWHVLTLQCSVGSTSAAWLDSRTSGFRQGALFLSGGSQKKAGRGRFGGGVHAVDLNMVAER